MPQNYFGSGYNYGRSPYAGPNRQMDGDPAFEAWRNRQFSSAPFSQQELQSGAHLMPTARSQALSPTDRLKAEADPRDILNSPAFKRLLELSGSTRATDASNATMAPALAEMQKMLAAADPLGVAGLGNLVRQKSTASLRDAGQGARRRAEESFGGLGSAADPASLAWMKDMLRVQEAGGMGEVNRAGSEADLAASQATAQFRQGVAQSLANIGLGQGQLELGQGSMQAGAAGSALTAESFARNTWADVFTRLLQEQMRPSIKRPMGGYYEDGTPKYDMNPFPSMNDFQTYLSGRNF